MTESSVQKSTFSLKPSLIILIIMFVFGCTKPGPEIVGVWDNVKSPEIVEFKPDGTGVFNYPKSQNPSLSFSWKKGLDNSFILDVNFMGTQKTLTATIRDKSLSIESSMGKELYQKQIRH